MRENGLRQVELLSRKSGLYLRAASGLQEIHIYYSEQKSLLLGTQN